MEKMDYTISFQPIVSLDAKNGYCLAGHEVLSRFKNEDTQTKIISLEKSGQIFEFDLDLIRTVLKSDELSRGRLSVNISSASLDNPNFLDNFEKLLSSSNSSNIDFEVTETFQPNIQHIERLISICHDHKLIVGLDDYGSGHSNFDLVQEIDFDFIKIDGSLIKSYDTSFVARAKVIQLTEYCNNRDIPVTAEFISDIKQIDQFYNIGITKGQGILFGLPEPKPYSNSKIRSQILRHDLPQFRSNNKSEFNM